MKVSEVIISRLNDEADLVSIIRRHTVLKPAGGEFKGNCPFHGEKTPSFFVNPQTNLYYCFGCGAKGNAISFLVDFEKLTFHEALKTLSLQTGIDLPKDNATNVSYKRTPPNKHATNNHQQSHKNTQNTPSQHNNQNIHNQPATIAPPIDDGYWQSLQQDDLTDAFGDHSDTLANEHFDTPHDLPSPNVTHGDYFNTNHVPVDPYYSQLSFDKLLDENANLYDLLTAVSQFYQAELKRHRSAYGYFAKRGLTDKTINDFELGYAPDGWQHLMQVFAQDIEGLKILGLVRTSSKGRTFCLFRDRVMFPIKDTQGRIVGFAGRALDDNVMPKYINSTDSVIFNKQTVLYGLYQARQQRSDHYLMVEGYMDVIALHQAGIFGAVAPMGTAANQKQIERLLKYNNSLTLCFDGDQAGQKAAMRTLEVAMPVLADGKHLQFLILPSEHDPDSFVKAYGKQAMITAIDNALTLSDYLYDTMAKEFDLSRPEQKAIANSKVRTLANKLPKGASFRYFLTNDFYQRLNKKPPKKTNHTNYDVDVTTPMQAIFLCILYNPSLASQNNITDLFHAANLHDIIDEPSLVQLSPSLAELIATAQRALPYLPHPNASTPDEIDLNAHFIFSAIANAKLKDTLTHHWQVFFGQAKFYQADELPLKYQELFCQILIDYYKAQQQHSQSLKTSQQYKRCIIALDSYFRDTLKPCIERQW